MLSKINVKQNKNNILAYVQKLGSTLMYSISILPIAGIFYGFSTIIGHNILSDIMRSMGVVIFGLLPISVFFSYISRMGDQSVNKYIPAFLFLLMYFVIQTLIANIDGIPSIFINNVYHFNYSYDSTMTNDLIIKSFGLSMFSGLVVGIIFNFTWSKINNIILIIGTAFIWGFLLIPVMMLITIILYSIGYIFSLLPLGLNAFSYGLLNRLLNPLGLHSLMIPAFTYSQVGGVLNLVDPTGISDQIRIVGDSAIWQYMFANNIPMNINNGNILIEGTIYNYSLTLNDCVGQYQQGFFPIMIFAYPIAGYAITRKIGWENGKMFLIASFIPMLTGITESFDFLYLFTNPLLYLLNAIFVGVSFMLMNLMHVHIWMSAGWIIDVLLFGIIPQIEGYVTNWEWILLIGPLMMIPYYLSFRYLFIYNKIK